MAISFRPISFHWLRTACVGLPAGLGGSLFFSCDPTASTANPAAKTRPATTFHSFITSPLRFAPTGSGRSLHQTRYGPRCFLKTGFLGVHLTQETAIRHSKFHAPERAKLDVYTRGGFHCELGLFAAARRRRFG